MNADTEPHARSWVALEVRETPSHWVVAYYLGDRVRLAATRKPKLAS